MKPDATSLDRLHDLVQPPPAPWWPPTPGWWIVLTVLALSLLALAVWLFMKWQADRYRREALVLLGDVKSSELSALTKRVALSVWPREDVARLTGGPWLAFLDRTGGMDAFVKGPGAGLETTAFDSTVRIDEPALKAAVREWILKHRKEAAP